MHLMNHWVWSSASLLTSVALFVVGTRNESQAICIAAVVLGASTLVASAGILNVRLAVPRPDAAVRFEAASHNASLMALAYAWGGSTLIAGYAMAAIYWQHALQYGFGMLAIATGLMALAAYLAGGAKANTGRPISLLSGAEVASLLQLVAALCGLAFLLASGKLATTKGDWAANYVFLAGGLTIAALSTLSVITHRRLSRN